MPVRTGLRPDVVENFAHTDTDAKVSTHRWRATKFPTSVTPTPADAPYEAPYAGACERIFLDFSAAEVVFATVEDAGANRKSRIKPKNIGLRRPSRAVWKNSWKFYATKQPLLPKTIVGALLRRSPLAHTIDNFLQMVAQMRKNKRRRHPQARATPWLAADIVVWSQRAGGHCLQCGAPFGNKRCLVVSCGTVQKEGRRCLGCANLDSMAFLPAGDARLTRRASIHSSRRAVVVRKRGKYIERCGILVAPAALLQACDEYDTAAPAACFRPIAGTKIILPPHPLARLISPEGERHQVAEARAQNQTPPRSQQSASCIEGRAPPRAASGSLSVKQIARLICEAYPDCDASRAREVARFALNHPDAEQMLANLRVPGNIGLLVSRYLRRRHADR